MFIPTMFGNSKHIRFFEAALATLLHRIFLRKHLSFFLPGLNGIHETLFGVFVVILDAVVVVSFDIYF